MKSLLFLITADPRTSGRPAEAVRIAAGLSAWKKIKAAVYLRDAAVLILQSDSEPLVDEDNFSRYLPILQENGQRLYAQKGQPLLTGTATFPVEGISDAHLAALAAESDHILRF